MVIAAAAVKEKIKAGTRRRPVDTEPLHMVGRLVKGTISRVRVPSLTFSFPQFFRSYWKAFWNGYTLPFKFTINGEVEKEVLAARVGFAVTFVLIDSVIVMGRYLFKKRIPWEIVAVIAVVVALADGIKVSDFTWLLLVPPVGLAAAVPFSVLRFRKWQGFKPVLKNMVSPVVEGKSEAHKGEII